MIFCARYCSICKSTHIERWGMSLVCRRLVWDGGYVHTTPVERAIIWRLMLAREGLRLEMRELIEAAWGHRSDGGPLAARIGIAVNLSRIRKALRSSAAPMNIANAPRGRGFRQAYEMKKAG